MSSLTEPRSVVNALADQATQIAAWLQVFVASDQTVELRALGVPARNVVREIFNSPDALAARAAQLDALNPRGIYFTPNPLVPDLAGRRGVSARKSDVVRRHWLLIDVDPVREPDTNANDAEREAAWAVLDCCLGELEIGCGLSSPVVASSGNGLQLCYPIDLANDDASQGLIKAILKGLNDRLPAVMLATAQVDPKCFDAPRIWKLYGTTARKGAATPERPHRMAWIAEGTVWNAETAAANSAKLPAILERWALIEKLRQGRPAGDLISRAKAYIAKEPPAIQGQDGSGRCFHVVSILVKGFALSEADAFEAIQEWNRTCQPPWSDAELRHKIRDAAAKPGPVGHLANARPSARVACQSTANSI